MALKLVTAPPGTGKTLLLIKMIFEYLKQGRRVYCNIDQLAIEEVLPIPTNADWRDYPDGSVVIYDEAQEHAAFSNDDLIDYPEYVESEQLDNETATAYRTRLSLEKKQYDRDYKKYAESIKDIARGLQVHRHFGFDIILATQDQSLLNTLTKKLVGEHYHLTRPFGLKGNMLFFWRRLQTNPDTREAKSSVEWKKHINFNKNYFSLYRSANVHTHKAAVPIKYIIVGLIILLICGSPFYLLSKSPAFDLMRGKKPEPETAQPGDIIIDKPMPTDLSQPLDVSGSAPIQPQNMLSTNTTAPAAVSQVAPVPEIPKIDTRQLAGCVKFGKKYRAYDVNGLRLKSKDHLCKEVIEDGDTGLLAAPRYMSSSAPQTTEDYQQQQQQTDSLVASQRAHFNEP